MFNKFTERARKVILLAKEEAKRFNHDYIGTEHILLGLIREGEGVAAAVLQKLGLSPEKIRLEVEKLVQSGPSTMVSGDIPFTPKAKKVIELAMEEARSLGHNYIGTEHLLLGLIREGEGVASQVLMNLGLDLNRVRNEVLPLLRDLNPGIESALVRKPRVGQQRDVGNGDRGADEPVTAFEQLLHQVECRLAALDPIGLARLPGLAKVPHVETAHRDVRLMAVLLPEQQFVDARGEIGVLGQQRTAVGEIAHDRIRLGEMAPIVELDHRHLAHGVHAQEIPGARLALQDVDRHPLVAEPEVIGGVLHLEAVAGDGVAVDLHDAKTRICR